mmetsp:Transcript_15205/g.46398  ORF Transcript_15205/g.46398 Transcript_15205/m.46398 type:complete len:214 (+) Transcript_15205:328-969(+)
MDGETDSTIDRSCESTAVTTGTWWLRPLDTLITFGPHGMALGRPHHPLPWVPLATTRGEPLGIATHLAESATIRAGGRHAKTPLRRPMPCSTSSSEPFASMPRVSSPPAFPTEGCSSTSLRMTRVLQLDSQGTCPSSVLHMPVSSTLLFHFLPLSLAYGVSPTARCLRSPTLLPLGTSAQSRQRQPLTHDGEGGDSNLRERSHVHGQLRTVVI